LIVDFVVNGFKLSVACISVQSLLSTSNPCEIQLHTD